MTKREKRDEIANMLLQGFCANTAIFASNQQSGWDLVNCNHEQLCLHAIVLAEQMLDMQENSPVAE